jgi:hypothetical protein
VSPAKKTNGSKATVGLVCPHVDVCEAPQRQSEMMRSLDDMSTSIQMLIQRVEQIHNEHLERAQVYIECNDEVLKSLKRVEERFGGGS